MDDGENKKLADEARKVLESLTEKERAVLKERLGIDLSEGASLEEIANQLGGGSGSRFNIATQFLNTRRRIIEIERKALRKLGKGPKTLEGPQCSFCSKYLSEVENLVQGIEGVNICSECVAFLSEVLTNGDEH